MVTLYQPGQSCKPYDANTCNANIIVVVVFIVCVILFYQICCWFIWIHCQSYRTKCACSWSPGGSRRRMTGKEWFPTWSCIWWPDLWMMGQRWGGGAEGRLKGGKRDMGALQFYVFGNFLPTIVSHRKKIHHWQGFLQGLLLGEGGGICRVTKKNLDTWKWCHNYETDY